MHPYFKHLLSSLSIEKTADQLQFQQFFQQKSLAEKRSTGLLWHPLVIKQVEPTWGDYIQVTVERPSHQDIPTAWKPGMLIRLYSLVETEEKPLEGIWQRGGGNQGVLFFKIEELPAWTRHGKLVLEALFDHQSYQIMEEAIQGADKQLPHSDLIQYLVGESMPRNEENESTFESDQFNASQCRAIAEILSNQRIVAIQGPPGTGKTTTLVEGVRHLTGSTWVCAPSHTAVDVITQRLVQAGVPVVRVGLPERMIPELWEVSLDRLVEEHPIHQQVKKIKKQAREFKRLAHQYKRSFGASERNQRKLLFEEAAAQDRWAADLEKSIVAEILKERKVVTGTLVGIRQIFPWMSNVDNLVLDEAGQSLEPACWVTIPRANRLILAGDPKQLPPTVFDLTSRLDHTLLSKVMERFPYTLLDVQYRMHPIIADFASQQFYHGKLTSGPHWETWQVEAPFQWIDTAGSGFVEQSKGTSWYNPEEGAWLLNQMHRYQQQNPAAKMVVIAPYKAQVDFLHQEIQSNQWPFTASTIDGFQGQEQEVVWISMTRSNPEGSIGFLMDLRRIHVAMTRAQKCVVLVGDSATWGQHDFFAHMLDYAELHHGYRSVWELDN